MRLDEKKISVLKSFFAGAIIVFLLIYKFESSEKVEYSETTQNDPMPVLFAENKTKSEPIYTDDEISKEIQDINQLFAKAAEKAQPSVVTVTVEKIVKGKQFNPFDFFFKERKNPEEKEYRQGGTGSGVIISNDGFIVTNNHVVGDADEVVVTLMDKREYKAEIVGTDPLTDIALIKVIDGSDFIPVDFSDSENLRIGDHVMAIGNPLGIGATVTSGIVSALNRNIQILGNEYAVETFIQTDAAINPGNSGGALVDLRGNLVGINTAIASRTGYYTGYGFAVPVNMVKHVIGQIKEYGKVRRGYIGIGLSSVNFKMAKSHGWKAPKGVYVSQVFDGKPGAKAGLKADDIVLEVDEKEVNEPNELQARVSNKAHNAKVKLKIFRDGKTFSKVLQLEEREMDGKSLVSNNDATKLDKLGLEVKIIDLKTKQTLEVSSGIMISNVEPYSEAYDSGLRSGDIILKVGKTELNHPREFFEYLQDKESGHVVKLLVMPASGSFKKHVYLEVQ
jgi:serine protease Do